MQLNRRLTFLQVSNRQGTFPPDGVSWYSIRHEPTRRADDFRFADLDVVGRGVLDRDRAAGKIDDSAARDFDGGVEETRRRHRRIAR